MNGRKRLVKQWLSCLLAMAMLLSGVWQTAALAATTSTSLQVIDSSGSIIVQEGGTASLSTGENVTIKATLGTADIEGKACDVRIYLGTTDSYKYPTLPYFDGGGKTEGVTRTVNGIKYTVCKDEKGEFYLNVTNGDGSKITSGTALTLPIVGYFPRATPNNAPWDIRLSVTPEGGTETTHSVKLTAKSYVEMKNTKTTSTSSIVLSKINDVDVINTDITYKLSSYVGNNPNFVPVELNPGEAPIQQYTITDTITLPDGITFTDGMDADAIFTTKNFTPQITISSDRKSATITYTYKNPDPKGQKPITYFNGDLTINKNSLTVGEGKAKEAVNITNEIKTDYVIKEYKDGKVQDKTKTAAPTQVPVSVQRPKTKAYSNAKKEVAALADKLGTGSYIVAGDFVIYKISFKNNNTVGDSAGDLTGASITDTLPDGLTPLTADDIKLLNDEYKQYMDGEWKTMNYTAGQWGDNGADANASGNTITFSGINLKAGDTFNGYVIAKAGDMPTNENGKKLAERTLTNKATINGVDVTADVKQEEPTPKLRISKTAYNTDGNIISYYTAGDTVKYVVKVINRGSADAKNVTIKDLFPSGLMDAAAGITISPEPTNTVYNTVNGNIAAETNEYTWDNVTIPMNGSYEITITAKIKEKHADGSSNESDVINKASYTCGDKTGEAEKKLENESKRPGIHADVNISKELVGNNQYFTKGDTFDYKIKLTSTGAWGGLTKIYNATTDNPLKIEDVLPPWLEVNTEQEPDISCTQGGSAVPRSTIYKTKDELKQAYQTSGVPYPGYGAGYGYITPTFENGRYSIDIYVQTYNPTEIIITIPCKVREDADSIVEEGTRFANTARVMDGRSDKANDIIYGKKPQQPDTPQDLEVKKEVSLDNGITWGETGLAKPGDSPMYRIRVTNKTTETLHDFVVYDDMQEMKFKPLQSNGQKYFDSLTMRVYKNGEVLTNYAGDQNSNKTAVLVLDRNKTDEYFSDLNETIRANKPFPILFSSISSEQWKTECYNFKGLNFALEPEEYIDIIYQITLPDGFASATNLAAANKDKTASAADCTGWSSTTLQGEAVLSMTKEALNESSNAATEINLPNDKYKNPEDVIIPYRITVTNDRTSAYAPGEASVLDRLPEGLMVAEPAAVSGVSGTFTTYAGNDFETMEVVSAGNTNNTGSCIKVDLGNNMKIPSLGSIVVTINTKLTPEAIANLKENSWDESKNFPVQTYRNTAAFNAENMFYIKGDGDEPVNRMYAYNTVTLKAKAPHPGIEKEAYAYMLKEGDDVSNNLVKGSDGAKPGAYLIWKIDIQNGSDADMDLSGYKIVDTLPSGYAYYTANKNGYGQPVKTNAGGLKYPDDIARSAKFDEFDQTNLSKGGVVIYTVSNGTKTTARPDNLTLPTAKLDGRKITWDFSNSQYTLKRGEHLVFTFITVPDDEQVTQSGLYYNKAVLETNGKVYEDQCSAGVLGTGGPSSGDSFTLSDTKTTSLKEAKLNTDANGNEIIKYTLTVKTDSSAPTMEHLALIDRLPSSGDTGVLTDQERGSTCSVEIVDGTVKVTNNGTDITGSAHISYSSGGLGQIFHETDADWDKNDGRVSWTTDPPTHSTDLMRVYLENIEGGSEIQVTFDAKPIYTSTTSDEHIYNSFGYCFDTAGEKNMAAEAKKSETHIAGEEITTGEIAVKKVFDNEKANIEEETFSVTVYDTEYNSAWTDEERNSHMAGGGTKSVTLRSANGVPSSADMLFAGIDFGNSLTNVHYYIYETDSDGVPLDPTKQKYTMYKGMYRTDKGVTSPDQAVTNGEITEITDGTNAFWKKDLNMSKLHNSAIFTNIIYGEKHVINYTTYVADVPVDGKGTAKALDTAKFVKDENGNITGTDIVDAAEHKRTVSTTYENGVWKDMGTAWGGIQSHTIATGFLAEITGNGTTVRNAGWNITFPLAGSEPVYMKLDEELKTKMTEKGYTVGDPYAEDVAKGDTTKIYPVSGNGKDITATVNDPFPSMTLASGATAYIGLIVDGIYSKGAYADLTPDNDIAADADKTAAAAGAADRAQYVKNPSPNQSNIAAVQGKMAVLPTTKDTTWIIRDEFNVPETIETLGGTTAASANVYTSARSNDCRLALYASDKKGVEYGVKDSSKETEFPIVVQNGKAHFVTLGKGANRASDDLASNIIALNVPAGATIAVTAGIGNDKYYRCLRFLKPDGTDAISDGKTMQQKIDEDNIDKTKFETTYDDSVNGRWYSGSVNAQTVTVKDGGMVYITSAQNGIHIYKIVVTVPKTESAE